MSEPTLPANPEGQYYTGSLYLSNGTSSDTGNGSIYLSNGDFLIQSGVTSLQKTFIHTTAGALTIDGSSGIDAQVSGQILLQSSSTAADSVKLLSTNAASNVLIESAGTGASAINLNSTAGGLTATSSGVMSLTSNNNTGTAIDINTPSGGIDIDANSTISATAGGLMTLESTSTSAGAVTINANGNGASLVINATGTGNDLDINVNDAITSDSATYTGTLTSTSATAYTINSAGGILMNSNDPTNGKFVVVADGAATDAIQLQTTDTSSRIILDSAGTGADSIRLTTDGGILADASGNINISTTATGSGSIEIDSAGEIKIDTTNTGTGIKIGTETAAVPVTIGTATSLTTIAGDLVVQGTQTIINTETILIEDNLIQLNSNVGSSGVDSGVVVRRYQTANASGQGNVVENASNSDKFIPQESGAFQTGSSTPGTLVLGTHASTVDDYYNGWWVRITSGSGSGQVRRIKDYTGSTQTATVYLTADNTTSPVIFNDGLDLVTAPAAADTYELYNQNSIALYWDESTNYYKLAGIPDSDLPGGNLLVANDSTLQYSDINTGVVKISPKKHNYMQGSASGTTITMTLKDVTERVAVGHKVMIENSSGFTPSINGTYTVDTVPTDNTFTFTVGASTTSAAGANASVSFLNTSKIYVNTIELNDPSFGSAVFPGLPLTEDINIGKTSTTPVTLTAATTQLYGAYLIVVEDLSTTGAMATFSLSRRSGAVAGDVNRMTNSRGSDSQRINMGWPSGARPRLFHSPAGSGAGNYTYRVRTYSIN